MAGALQASYLGMPLELNERDVEDGAYFAHCAQGDFRLQSCSRCGLLRYPPSPSCPWCAHPESQWVPVEGRGTIHSYMEVHHAIQPAFREAAPFLILLVELDTQRGQPTQHEALRVIGNLVTPEGKLVRATDTQAGIGTRVRMVFTPVAPGLALPQWTVDEAATGGAPAWRYPG